MVTYATYVSEPGVFLILLKQCKGIFAHWDHNAALLDNESHYITFCQALHVLFARSMCLRKCRRAQKDGEDAWKAGKGPEQRGLGTTRTKLFLDAAISGSIKPSLPQWCKSVESTLPHRGRRGGGERRARTRLVNLIILVSTIALSGGKSRKLLGISIGILVFQFHFSYLYSLLKQT